MTALLFPCTIFKTQRRMNDNSADDMRCGDLSESRLKRDFHLVDVSTRVDPWTLTKITPFRQPHSRFYGSRGEGEKITREACARILFDEFRHLSQSFSFYGPYRFLIQEMITHMQFGQGAAFSSSLLDTALKRQIVNDKSPDNSSLMRLKEVLSKNIDRKSRCFPAAKRDELRKAITFSKLPKFDSFKDNLNGMGITVHDTWATHITIKSLDIGQYDYKAVIHYKIQDHFGLDQKDMLNSKFHLFRLFRIWFILQRYSLFGFRPFINNMECQLEIKG